MRRTITFIAFILSALLTYAETPVVRPQIWDFGAVSFDRTRYENMLTTREINAWMPAAIPGSPNNYITDFLASKGVNLAFFGHNHRTHRLRTTNTKLSRFDETTLYDAKHDALFTGVLVSNAKADPEVYIEQSFLEGDYIEYAVASSGAPATYQLSSADGQFAQTRKISGQGAEVIWFTIPRRGRYRLACLDDKLMVARIIRYQAEWGELHILGKIPKQCSLAIVNRENGATHTIAYNETNIRLPLGFVYGVTLLGDPTKMITTADSVNFQHNGQTLAVKVKPIQLNEYKGKIVGLPEAELSKLTLQLQPKYPTTFHAFYELNGNRYTLYTEPNNQYIIRPHGVNDYEMDTIAALTDLSQLVFTKKPTIPITITADIDLSNATLQFTNTNEPDYVYSFVGTDEIALRKGQYSVAVLGLDSFQLLRTSLLQVRHTEASKRLEFRRALTANDSLYYQDTLRVGVTRPYTTIRAALRAAERMHRQPDQHITICIDPGQYDEMLRINTPNITLTNASATPSTAIRNNGIDIHKQAVRITGYYGAEYNYYSMTERYMHSNLALRVNMENKAPGVLNNNERLSFYNATVVIAAEKVSIEGIIIENAFNRYVSRLESRDKLVPQYAQTPLRPANFLSYDVQQKQYQRGAAALAIAGMADMVELHNCRLIGVENTLYGDAGCRVYLHNCHIMGAHNIIFGGMTLLCYQSAIEVLPTQDNNYLFAARTQVGLRGFLFYQCFICSAMPLEQMASEQYSTPCALVKQQNHFGEVIFVDTQFDLPMKPMEKSPALSARIDEPEFADMPITPYIYTSGTDCWNPTHDPEGTYDKPTDLHLGIHTDPGELVMHHIAEPTTMRAITSDGSTFIDQLLTGTQTFKMPKGVYWLIFENNQGKQYKKVEIQ